MLDKLNEEQKKAAIETEGAVIVFAGAGSGKTRTLTYRIAYMLVEKNIAPENILAITFTNKATKEMLERLNDLAPIEAPRLTISTFHSWCARILRREIHHLGYKKSFQIIDEDEQQKIIKEVLDNADVEKRLNNPRAFQKRLNYAKCTLAKMNEPKEERLRLIYEEELKSNNLLDFEDLLLKVKKLFETNKEVLEKYQDIYHYILVDEFQDTSIVQYEIIKMLAQKRGNIFVVGDDDQSIYSFRGTNYENVSLFKKDFKDVKTFKLEENYRSSQKILDGCNRLISYNLNREKKELFSQIKGFDEDIVVYQAADERDEANYIANVISGLIKKGVRPKEIAVLYRNSVLLRNIEISLVAENIAYKVYGGFSYLRRKEIKDVIAFFRLIVNPDDLYSFKRVINEPSRKIGKATISHIEEFFENSNKSLFETIKELEGVITGKKYEEIIKFIDMIKDFSSRLETTPLVDLYDEILFKTGYLEMIQNEDESQDKEENIMEFKSILVTIDDNGVIDTKANKLQEAFDEAILADDKLRNQNETYEGVTCSTIHSIKGLEFTYVFLIGLEEGIFPNAYKQESFDEIEEERRVAYVACTRAKKRLYLMTARRRMIYGSYVNSKQSRFLLEFAQGKASEKQKIKQSIKALNGEKKDSSVYEVGDKIVHKFFGEGIIVSKKENIGTICFAKRKEIKQFDLGHPTISRQVAEDTPEEQ